MSVCVDYGDHHDEMMKEHYQDIEERTRKLQIAALQAEVDQLRKEVRKAYEPKQIKPTKDVWDNAYEEYSKDEYQRKMKDAIKSFLHDQEKEELKKALGIVEEKDFIDEDEMTL